MNIILIGYRGSGKSAVGSRLAEHLGMQFVDTDDLIEKHEGTPISEIVASRGWDFFRELEKEMVQEISARDHCVIAPGGGAVLDSDNVMALKRNGVLVWLKADPSILVKRIHNDCQSSARRPTLTGKGTLEETQETLSLREPFYAKASDTQVDTSVLDVEAVVKHILGFFNKS